MTRVTKFGEGKRIDPVGCLIISNLQGLSCAPNRSILEPFAGGDRAIVGKS